MARSEELSLDQVGRHSPAYDTVRKFCPQPTEFYELRQDNQGNAFYVKDETDNPTGAYKWRGSAVKLSQLFAQGESRVVTASAGNHGQGIAWVAGTLGGSADVFVPIGTPQSKLDGLARLGARVYSVGFTYDEATMLAKEHAAKYSTHFVPAFDDIDVMRGQGTIADELVDRFALERMEYLDTVVFVPVGGGGLLGGVAERLYELTGGQVHIVGVQVAGSDSAALSFGYARNCRVAHIAGGRRIYSPRQFGEVKCIEATAPNDNVDGTRVSVVGQLCLPKIVQYVHEFVVVDPAEIGKYFAQNPATHLEPAGALAQVGANLYAQQPGASLLNLVALHTGRNQDSVRIQNLIGELKDAA